ncbi:MAG TPA: hypothetical protein PKX48_01345 [Planctomycetota bacterium]|jgi:hypothetical protein|nr:hypothetical protein [Planctomycetota bacterium]OQC22063.1 MAG: hypothetical protein BWX69_00373 [Planctomycetes bacterium ADurb.Bin069]NMD35285.1 hypothetical protein [Planctomycetota bacterium]HNR98054.1 hypothetical protein [Planctomycetota bacterium]HNU25803.1 hypothetical protein [Planctomycetota bacterium]
MKRWQVQSVVRETATRQKKREELNRVGTCAVAMLLLATAPSGCAVELAPREEGSRWREGEKLARDREASLKEAMKGADYVVIKECSPVIGWPGCSTRIYEVRGTSGIEGLLHTVVVDPAKTLAEYAKGEKSVLFLLPIVFMDSITLEFFRTNVFVGRLRLNGLHALFVEKPEDLWAQGVWVTDESAQGIAHWLAGHGAEEHSKRLLEESNREDQERQVARDVIELWPGLAKGVVSRLLLPKNEPSSDGLSRATGRGEECSGVLEGEDVGDEARRPAAENHDQDEDGTFSRVGERIRTLMPDRIERTIAACRTLGADHSDWGWGSDPQRLAAEAMRDVGAAELTEVMVRLGGDRAVLLGAAELYFSKETSFSRWLDKDAADRWLPRLIENVLCYEESFANRYEVLRFVVEERRTDAVEVLLRIAAGESPVWICERDGWMSIDVAACLAAALLGADAVGASARELLGADSEPWPSAPWMDGYRSPIDRVGLDLSLALLGNYGHLRAEQFVNILDTNAPFDIEWVAREALRRFNGRDGVGLVIQGIRDRWIDYETRDLVIEMLGLHLSEEEDPDQALLAWWSVHGDALVRDRRAKYPVVPSENSVRN